MADRHQALAAAWRGNWPRVAGVLPHAAETSQSRPLSPRVRPLHFHSLTPALSLSSALPCSRRGTRQRRRAQHRLRHRLACAASHHHCLHLAYSYATPPSTPRLDCSGCHASVRAYSLFPFSPKFSVAMAASTTSLPWLGSSTIFFRLMALAFGQDLY